jgi:hypothetical protein
MIVLKQYIHIFHHHRRGRLTVREDMGVRGLGGKQGVVKAIVSKTCSKEVTSGFELAGTVHEPLGEIVRTSSLHHDYDERVLVWANFLIIVESSSKGTSEFAKI